jgi:hypothetical protein
MLPVYSNTAQGADLCRGSLAQSVVLRLKSLPLPNRLGQEDFSQQDSLRLFNENPSPRREDIDVQGDISVARLGVE